MFVLIVGCGRVGSAIAKTMQGQGHEVSVLDEDPEAIAMLERGRTESWEEAGGTFTDRAGVPAHDRGTAVSSNGLLHDEIIARLSVNST